MSYASEEEIDLLKEHCTFKEATKSPYKDVFAKAMIQEINNYATREHWEHVLKSDAHASLILRQTWTFRIKRNAPTGAIVKFKARLCADGRTQKLGVNFHETCDPFVKWNSMCACLTQAMLNN